MREGRSKLGPISIGLCSLLLLACSAADSGNGRERLPSLAAPGGVAGSASAPPAGTFGNAGSGAQPLGAPAAPDTMTVDLPGGACAATSLQAQQVVVEEEVEVEVEVTQALPVAIYIMLDQSSSMNIGYPAPWNVAIDSINAFVTDATSAGVDVALQYFPIDGGGCDGSGYDTPEVAIGRLPGHAANVMGSLGARWSANGGATPIEAALRGLTRFCSGFSATHPDEDCVGVLITDGEPSDGTSDEGAGCNKDFGALAQIAGDAYTQDGTTIFAVGMNGANFVLLDDIAARGGSDCDPNGAGAACNVTAGGTTLTQALARIRDTVTTVETRTEIQTRVESTPLPCEWEIPPPPAGESFDRDRVNVALSSNGAALPQLGRVESEGECVDNAWFYDDPAAPEHIRACPATCNTIAATSGARVDILLGCETVVLE